MSTIVRLAKILEDHTNYPKMPDAPAMKQDITGRLIKIGKPQEPSMAWFCDTDVIWPALWIEGLGDLEPPRFVCRHQIEAGD